MITQLLKFIFIIGIVFAIWSLFPALSVFYDLAVRLVNIFLNFIKSWDWLLNYEAMKFVMIEAITLYLLEWIITFARFFIRSF